MKKILLYSVGALFLWALIHTLVITYDGLNDQLGPTDVAVVLGSKVERDGEPSEGLKGRLYRAVELYQDNQFDYIIVSGGYGKEGFDEAIVMKEYLIENGVSNEKIFLDSNGYNTKMTAENTKEMMDEMGFESVTVISQFFHISRIRLAFRKVGVDQVNNAHSKYFGFRDVYSTIREYPAFYKYLFY